MSKDFIQDFLTVVFVINCLFLMLVVLLQPGKGGGMGSAFGGASQTVFGGAGASNFLTRLTVISAVMFMVLSGTLAYLSTESGPSFKEEPKKEESPRTKAKSPGPESASSGTAAEPEAPSETNQSLSPATGTEASEPAPATP